MKQLQVSFPILLLGLVITACSNGNNAALQERIDSLQTKLKKFADEKASVAAHLARFDSLDFEGFNKQNYELFNQIHAEDVIVTWPDGHKTNGIVKHDEDIKTMFVYIPDFKVDSHPVSFGSGDWTCGMGMISGTFSKPMPIGGGKTIPPTGKHFSIPMCTVAKWKDGRIIEETLFWDNHEFMKQTGLAK